ncbi:ParB N-terminal domain-containing protein [Delftia tsuruhatensis]|uniref:ParB N-terminal domain-containing protein n=1 Tax=Delftia tsuruhatensis TaxID=180282 RepID=UPI000A5175C7|nr:ParB N-terminal domain-containing protein [Delftia tsuruhatensis]
MTTPKKIRPDITQLDFDPQNPRFLDVLGISNGDEEAIKRMIEEENLDELVGSIGNQGFFPGEPLLVTPNIDEPGRFIVVEGNRRLASLRVLNGIVKPELLTKSLIDLVKAAKSIPKEIDCFEFPQRKDILKYLGFRHISGPRRWEPLSKARYLSDLVKNFYQNLGKEEQIRAVAKDIGSRRDYVAQLLTTLNLYDRARSKDFYGLQRVDEEDINFSLLSTALSYTNIVQFLGLEGRDAVNVESVNDDNAKDLFRWMFAQMDNGETVLGESRRLKNLAAVLASESATIKLRDSNNLDQAYLFSEGPSEALTSLLGTAEAAIMSCKRILEGDIDVEDSQAKLAEKISFNADDLQMLLQRAVRRTRLKRQTEES